MNRFKYLSTSLPFKRNHSVCTPCKNPMHLICFKQWTSEMVLEIITSAINLKCSLCDTHLKKLTLLQNNFNTAITHVKIPVAAPTSFGPIGCPFSGRVFIAFLLIGAATGILHNILQNAKVMMLKEVNEPCLNLAVSKAASLLGATDVSINEKLVWDNNYLGRLFSMMCDIIFVSTSTHGCVSRFAEQSSVPVMCVRSRAHGSLQALATIMTIIEEYRTMNCVNVAYIGKPHPVLNSYILLCPMLGANLKFKCCCDKCPVSPLLLKAGKDMTEKGHTIVKQCKHRDGVLKDACVIIAGPATNKESKMEVFKFGVKDINRCVCMNQWIFFHTLPRGAETEDELFMHTNARTFNAFNNMQYIAAALMAKAVQDYVF